MRLPPTRSVMTSFTLMSFSFRAMTPDLRRAVSHVPFCQRSLRSIHVMITFYYDDSDPCAIGEISTRAPSELQLPGMRAGRLAGPGSADDGGKVSRSRHRTSLGRGG